MGYYKKKPVIIYAEQYELGMEDGFDNWGDAVFVHGLNPNNYNLPECAKFKGMPYIETLEGKHYISDGDYIITGIRGERYPCKKDIFKESYEEIERS